MLVRLLHRPLLRSVAAAWQPATTSALLHKGDRRRYNTNEPGQPHQDDQQDDQHNRVVGGLAASQSEPKLEPVSSSPAEKKKKSLFEKLFPDELKQARSTLKRDDVNTFRNSWVSQIFEEPPRPGQTALEKPRSESGEKGKEDESPSTMAASDFYKSSGPRGKAMLILSGASKHLNESDFMRLGMKGKHLDGWMGGIQKVIQSRDSDTLEPKGQYVIFFETHEAAMVYHDRIEELWKLGKQYVPRAHHKRAHMMQDPLPLGMKRTKDGQDLKKLIQSFTLVPPSQRRQVELSRMTPEKIEDAYRRGSFVDQLVASTGSQFLVLLRLEGGWLSVENLRRAIEHDGEQRNLPWRITNLYNGILPFGKSILKSNDRVHRLRSNTFDDTFLKKLMIDAETDRVGRQVSAYDQALDQQVDESNENHRQFPRFIVPFEDKAEAHRFVRNWHRRELTIQMGGRDFNEPFWEASRIINASLLW